jgi:hypothetical protein
LLIVALAAFFYWVKFVPSGKRFLAEQNMEWPWDTVMGVADAIQTDEGALALYRDNPLLKGSYPTEDDFLKSAAAWRGKVAGLPRTPPLQDWMDGDWVNGNGVGMRRSIQPGHGAGTLEVFYAPAEGTQIRLYLREGEGLVEIDIR